MYYVQKSLLITWCLCLSVSIAAQSFFKVSTSTDLLDQKVATFSNSDVLIGNSSTAPVRTGNENGILMLKRIDPCGNTIWEKQYDYAGGYLILKDITINQSDDIFMFGSHYKGLTESVFIAKIDNGAEDEVDFRIFNPTTVDHFTYSIDLNANQILIYGLLLDFNSSKQGFIGVFDQNLNAQFAHKFVPFESTGEAIFSNDGGIIARSGPYIYKFDSDYDLEWAFVTKRQQDILNISGPFQTNSGWIFESHSNDTSFLYKLNPSGDIVWTSDQIDKTNVGGDLSKMTDGNYSFVYNRRINSGTEIGFLTIDQLGNTISEQVLEHGYSMNIGEIKHQISHEQFTVIGSKNLFATGNVEVENFILQFNGAMPLDNCIEPIDFINTTPNNQIINLEKLTIEPEEFQFEIIDRIKLNSVPTNIDLDDLCNPSQDIIPMIESNTIPCSEVWPVSLPNSNFRWDDGVTSLERDLSVAGSYTARNVDCLQQEVIEFVLATEECGCEIYVPNAFSPNGDEVNDLLELGIFCELESIEVFIFDKWGGLIFESDTITKMWSGRTNGQDAPSGIYSIIINYSWQREGGVMLEDNLIQAITILR